VGGDLFDYWMQGETLCLVQADVSGHDMGAALMATALRSVMRSETAHRQSVSGLMSQVNKALFDDLCNAELFISVFYGEVNLETGLMTYCRAGHPLPLLVGPEREEWLDTAGMLFGILEEGGFGEGTVQLQQGEAIVFYTDGLVECGESHDEFFGTEGVQHAAESLLGQEPTSMAEGIVQAARDHAGDMPIADDMTAMVLRLAP
jgi:sigma-B regulation protein RsbU (phosphoserine phosphatase)